MAQFYILREKISFYEFRFFLVKTGKYWFQTNSRSFLFLTKNKNNISANKVHQTEEMKKNYFWHALF